MVAYDDAYSIIFREYLKNILFNKLYLKQFLNTYLTVLQHLKFMQWSSFKINFYNHSYNNLIAIVFECSLHVFWKKKYIYSTLNIRLSNKRLTVHISIQRILLILYFIKRQLILKRQHSSCLQTNMYIVSANKIIKITLGIYLSIGFPTESNDWNRQYLIYNFFFYRKVVLCETIVAVAKIVYDFNKRSNHDTLGQKTFPRTFFFRSSQVWLPCLIVHQHIYCLIHRYMYNIHCI